MMHLPNSLNFQVKRSFNMVKIGLFMILSPPVIFPARVSTLIFCVLRHSSRLLYSSRFRLPAILTLFPLPPTSSLLGYPTNHKGFRCLDLASNKVLICRHFVFAEQIFPFSPLSSPTASSPSTTVAAEIDDSSTLPLSELLKASQ